MALGKKFPPKKKINIKPAGSRAAKKKNSDFETLAMTFQTSVAKSPLNRPSVPATSDSSEEIEFIQRPRKKSPPLKPKNAHEQQATLDVPMEQFAAHARSQQASKIPVEATVNMEVDEYLGTQTTADNNHTSAERDRENAGKATAQLTNDEIVVQQSLPTSTKDPLNLLGTLFASKYQIVDFLGAGGMGAVYLGQHRLLGKKYAIKVLPKNSNLDKQMVHRFIKEGRAAASVEHPNIVQVHDVDETKICHYILMEYVTGDSLDECVKQVGPLAAKDAMQVIREAALGLGAIHKAGLVHRDIKPANLLISVTGQIKITDFGIVKDLGGQTDLTATSTIIGTPQFMAPELITKKDIDGRSDIYSLGATLYFILTGETCFSGTSMQLMYQILEAQPIPPHKIKSTIPLKLSKVIIKMLAKKPQNRYQNVEELCEVLAPFCS